MSSSFYSNVPSASKHALRGLALTGGTRVGIHREPDYVWAVAPNKGRRVGIISGGGSGHEPLHTGFVGRGGLDAAVPGEVFTSPHSRQIHAASRKVARAGGVLHVVKNYTGDRINFSIAAERLRAEGIEVDEVVVDEDEGSDGQDVGRRGTAATVVVEKILGAAADRGFGLSELAHLGRDVVQASRSIAVASEAHSAPGTDGPAFTVRQGELEYGVGIHGEVARETIQNPGLRPLVNRMVAELLGKLPKPKSGVIAVVNGLGGTGNMELLHVLADLEESLRAREIDVCSAVAGTYVSALNMTGFSITLTSVSEGWLHHWLAPHQTLSLPGPVATGAVQDCGKPKETEAGRGQPSAWLMNVAERFTSLKERLNQLDQQAGDGDLGSNLAAAVSSATARSQDGSQNLEYDVNVLAMAFLEEVGGSSGPLFGILLKQIAVAMRERPDVPAEAAAHGLKRGVESLMRIGNASAGDRTMVDALLPASQVGDSVLDSEAVEAAIAGASATRQMLGRRGRSSYLGKRVLGSPDPGAVAAVMILAAIVEGLSATPLQRRQREAIDELLVR